MDLRKVPGCHVYGGAVPLAAGIAKIPKERNLIFNIDSETEEALKDVPSFKVPFDKERPLPLECFDTIVKALVDEGDKTQCVFSSKEEIPATLGKITNWLLLSCCPGGKLLMGTKGIWKLISKLQSKNCLG